MDGWRSPVGPEPARVYWLRRLLVALAALVVAIVVVLLVAQLRPSPKPVSAPTQARPAPTAPVQPGTSASVAPASVTPTPSGPAPAPCDASKLNVSVAGPSTVTLGAATTLTVAVRNVATTACTLEFGPEAFALTITSGSARIWSTQDCAGWLGPAQTVRVEPNASAERAVEWTGRRSLGDCRLADADLRPGTYVARAAFGAASGSAVLIGRG